MEKTSKKIVRVAFFGDADAKVAETHYKLAYETAKLLATNGYIVVDGGGPGVMEAATKGAKAAKGKVELVIMDRLREPENYEGVDVNNLDYATKVYVEESYPARLNKLVAIADAFVIFKGGTGTLSEVGMVWEQAKFEYGHHEPIIFVGKEWEEVVKILMKRMNFEEKEKRVVATVEKPEEILRALTRAEN